MTVATTRAVRPRRTTWLVLIVTVAIATITFYAYQFAVVGSAYAAHMLCSAVFISGRAPESVLASDLSADDLAPLRLVSSRVDVASKAVTTHVLGVARRTAAYRDGLGCTVGEDARPSSSAPGLTHVDHDPWTTPRDDRERRLSEVLDWAFAEPDPQHQRRTRAVVVLHDHPVTTRRHRAPRAHAYRRSLGT